MIKALEDIRNASDGKFEFEKYKQEFKTENYIKTLTEKIATKYSSKFLLNLLDCYISILYWQCIQNVMLSFSVKKVGLLCIIHTMR